MAETLETYAATTYNYLRLAIVLVTATLLVSIGFEAGGGHWCFVGSISGYYYTPVRTVFVGALIAIGVCLIAIKENTPAKDSLLNLAGAMGPIVAFVPTTFPCESCTSTRGGFVDTGPGIVNNVAAYVCAGLMAVILGWFVAWKQSTVEKPDTAALIVLGVAIAMLIGGWGWYVVWTQNFLDHAHMISAIGLFGVVGVVMLLNSCDPKTTSPRLHNIYRWTPIAMAVGAVVILFVKWKIRTDWQHHVLILELVELLAFLVYWIAQTVEQWNAGVKGAAAPPAAPAAPS